MIKINQRRVLEKISENDILKKAFNFFLNYNTGYNNPYHNINHTLAMMDLMLKLNDAENIDIEILLLAAIFHDMNHSGGLITDEKNVQNAIYAYKMFTQMYHVVHDPQVEDLIKATQFPYTNNDLSYNQRIIRECDNLVPFYDDFFTQVLMGLRSEMHTTDLNTLCDNELKFLENSWNNLELRISKQLILMYGDELKEYINNIKKLFI